MLQTKVLEKRMLEHFVILGAFMEARQVVAFMGVSPVGKAKGSVDRTFEARAKQPVSCVNSLTEINQFDFP